MAVKRAKHSVDAPENDNTLIMEWDINLQRSDVFRSPLVFHIKSNYRKGRRPPLNWKFRVIKLVISLCTYIIIKMYHQTNKLRFVL